MKFKIIADENIQKKYRIEVSYDYDDSYLWDDIQSLLTESGIEIYSNLRNYKLADNERRFEGKEELIEQGYDIRPIYAYIHGGIALSLGRGGQFSDQFDSGLAGFAAVEGKFTPEQEKVLSNYIEDYNNLESDTYYQFAIYDEDDNFVDGVGGFAGSSDEEIADEMFDHIDSSYGITKNNILWALKHPRG